MKAKGYSNALLLPGLLGPCLQLIMLVVLLVLPDKFSPRSMRRSRVRSEHSSEFQMERIVRCRRNALAGNALGLAGILMGTLLIAFTRAPFEDRNNEFVLGMVIFIVGYFCVITGCWWWAKAKAWPQAVVLIGLLPFAIGSIPGMHRVLVSTPGLLPATMIVTPLIQIVTLLVLPDRSRMPRQK